MPRPFAQRVRLKPGQTRTIAHWRFDDARCLWRTKLVKHMNGAVYLGGLTIDCLLKARLLAKHPHLLSADRGTLGPADAHRWNLIFRYHDLEAIVAELPETVLRLQSISVGPPRLDTMLKSACSRWSIHVRYLAKRVDSWDAEQFLEQVEELRKWL